MRLFLLLCLCALAACGSDERRAATPFELDAISPASISTGRGHSCAVVDGAAKCWGRNDEGQLGDGTERDTSTPVQVIGLTSGVTAISVGEDHTCAIHQGAAKCWGHKGAGVLGDGTQTTSSVPVQVVGLTSGVTAIAAGYNHTCAIHDGATKCWGSDREGQLGDGVEANIAPTPVQVVGLASGVSAISAGGSHTCAIERGGAKCWGANLSGQLGDGSRIDTSVPGLPVVYP